MRFPRFGTFTLRGTTRPLAEWLEVWKGLSSPPVWEREVYRFIATFLAEEKIPVTTSGTTGTPRTLRISREKMVASAEMTVQHLGLKRGDSALLCLPVRYIAGKMMIVRALVGDLDLWPVAPTTTPAVERPYTLAAMTPHQAASLLQSPDGEEKIRKIDHLLLGGSPLPPTLEGKLSRLDNDIRHTYGMTETLSHVAMRHITGPNRSLWFSPLPGIKITLDKDQHLVIEASKLHPGRLVTKDLAETDRAGRFRILGRSDHVINSGGIKIFPEMLERILSRHLSMPFFLAGIPDELLGEKAALIVESPEDTSTLLPLFRKAIDEISHPLHRPKEIILLPQFIRTPSGKIRRKETLLKALSTGERLPA